MTADDRGELDALRRISAILPSSPADEVWMGDDTAVVYPAGGALLLTVDTVVENVHADLGITSLGDLGWRAVTTAVSDIAAMGGCPDQLLVSVAAPPATDVESLYTGISDAAASDGAAVVGGDLSTAKQVVVSVTVVGHVPGDCPPVLRSGAKPGDVLFVTGPLGAAGAGLRLLRAPGARSVDGHLLEHLTNAHRRPVARIAEGCTAREAGATSMIDLSDGLASDVRRLAVASGVGVRLRDIPVAKGATAEEALSAGDDYELLFSAPEPDRVKRAFDAAGLRSPLIIGECSPDRHELTLEGDDLSAYGWQHPW